MIHTPRGDIATPAFMPVGTAATVKAMLPDIQAVSPEGMELKTDFAQSVFVYCATYRWVATWSNAMPPPSPPRSR